MEYLILIYSDDTNRPPPTEESMQRWFSYTAELKAAGVYVGGNALQGVDTARSIRNRDGKTLTTDGPFAETKEQLGGYYMVKCDTREEADHWGAKCPGADYGTIEVRPIMQLPT